MYTIIWCSIMLFTVRAFHLGNDTVLTMTFQENNLPYDTRNYTSVESECAVHFEVGRSTRCFESGRLQECRDDKPTL